MSRPRILLLTTYYHPVLGGVETNARRLAAFLHRQGFDVLVVTKRVRPGAPHEEVIDGVPVVRVPPAGERSPGGKWRMLPFAFLALLRLRARYDLICCIDYRGIGLAALAAGRLLGRPVIVQAGTTGVLSCANWNPALVRCRIAPAGRLARWLKRPLSAAYRSATAFLCISREIEREALESGVPPARVHYMPHSIDVAEFRPPLPGERDRIRAEEGWPAGRPICLFLGRLSLEKGVLDLVQAWNLVDRPEATLVVVGPDMPGHAWDAGPRARDFVASHQLEDRVIFTGPRQDTARLLRAADIFVQPSHFEAFGISVIEAMATGLAVVASRVGGMRDYLSDEDNALFAPPEDPAGLAAPLRRLIDDAGLRGRLAAAARATVERSFDEAVVFGRTADLFVALAAGGGR
ncbi:MAG: glycosyltransferase family 4 protein [Acidobacteriota bacterium]|nr:glycosyltransferase family 4 protein [Acidobacteriota bacterium]